MAEVVQVSFLWVLTPILQYKLLLLSSVKKELCQGVCRNGDRGSTVVKVLCYKSEDR